MSVFRVEKNRNFTVMSNYHLHDINLSNKAKGLLSVILSLPDDWDYTSEGLARICKDGKDSIRAQLRELESFGYITRERARNERGQLKGCDYTIHEIPVTAFDLSKPEQKKPKLENPTQGKPTLENPTKLNTNISNTDILKTKVNNQSINQIDIDMIDMTKSEEKIAEQIEADLLNYDCPQEQIKEIVSIIADVIRTPADTVKVNGVHVSKENVLRRYSQLNSEHIRYVLDAMERCSPNIKNIRSYLITALYNAPTTIDNYYTALFNQNNKAEKR